MSKFIIYTLVSIFLLLFLGCIWYNCVHVGYRQQYVFYEGSLTQSKFYVTTLNNEVWYRDVSDVLFSWTIPVFHDNNYDLYIDPEDKIFSAHYYFSARIARIYETSECYRIIYEPDDIENGLFNVRYMLNESSAIQKARIQLNGQSKWTVYMGEN